MEPNSWAAIESLYQRALERRPDERSAWLQQACAGDVVLLERVGDHIIELIMKWVGQGQRLDSFRLGQLVEIGRASCRERV